MQAQEHPGWRWGPFTTRVPFLHTRLYWSEFLQGVFVASATGLALVPLMTSQFGLTFEEAVAASLIHSFLITSAAVFFGEPYAPGWITPALPLVLTFVMGGYEDPSARWQAMTALSIDFAAICFVLGITGMGKRFMLWLPDVLKAGIILGAAIAALKRVFIDDAERFLLEQPISTVAACAICLVITFSIPLQKLKAKYRFLALMGALGLLPGFLFAAALGPLVGEVHYDIQWGILIPPFADLWAKVSPLVIGWPDTALLLHCLPLALVAYVIVFGDLITGNEVLKEAIPDREDEKIDINPTRSHLSLAIRNAVMGVAAPFFPTQGSLWTGVHVIVVQRWREGRETMNSLHSGIASYYLMSLPFIFLLMPLLTGLKPLMGIALSLTLVLTGFACAYVAMAIPKQPTERGVVLLTAVALALFAPWQGLLVGIAATILLVGWKASGEE